MRVILAFILIITGCTTVREVSFASDFERKFGKTVSINGLYLHQGSNRNYLCPMSVTEDLEGCILLAGKLQFDSSAENLHAKCVVATGRLDPPNPTRSELRIGLRGRMEPAQLVRCVSSN